MGGTNSMSWDPEGWGTSNPETGDANSPIGRFFQGAFGKHGATTGQLPAGLKWVNDFAQQLAGGAASNLNFGTANAGQAAGVTGANAMNAVAGGTLPGTAAAWNAGLGGLGEGLQTGFQPSMSEIDAALRPTAERSFQTGAADIREQNALTGNLSSTGASQQIGDYRAQVDNALGSNVANIYGATIPSAINARTSLTQTGLALPAANTAGIYGPATASGYQGQQSILDAINSAFGAIGQSPYSAQQGSGGSGGGQALGGLMSKGCWVAEAIFGIDTIETELARHYVNHLAPLAFRARYFAHGRELAARVAVDPELRERLRPKFLWMAARAADALLTTAPTTVH